MKRLCLCSIIMLLTAATLSGCGRAGKPVGTCKAETFPDKYPASE